MTMEKGMFFSLTISDKPMQISSQDWGQPGLAANEQAIWLTSSRVFFLTDSQERLQRCESGLVSNSDPFKSCSFPKGAKHVNLVREKRIFKHVPPIMWVDVKHGALKDDAVLHLDDFNSQAPTSVYEPFIVIMTHQEASLYVRSFQHLFPCTPFLQEKLS